MFAISNKKVLSIMIIILCTIALLISQLLNKPATPEKFIFYDDNYIIIGGAENTTIMPNFGAYTIIKINDTDVLYNTNTNETVLFSKLINCNELPESWESLIDKSGDECKVKTPDYDPTVVAKKINVTCSEIDYALEAINEFELIFTDEDLKTSTIADIQYEEILEIAINDFKNKKTISQDELNIYREKIADYINGSIDCIELQTVDEELLQLFILYLNEFLRQTNTLSYAVIKDASLNITKITDYPDTIFNYDVISEEQNEELTNSFTKDVNHERISYGTEIFIEMLNSTYELIDKKMPAIVNDYLKVYLRYLVFDYVYSGNYTSTFTDYVFYYNEMPINTFGKTLMSLSSFGDSPIKTIDYFPVNNITVINQELKTTDENLGVIEYYDDYLIETHLYRKKNTDLYDWLNCPAETMQLRGIITELNYNCTNNLSNESLEFFNITNTNINDFKKCNETNHYTLNKEYESNLCLNPSTCELNQLIIKDDKYIIVHLTDYCSENHMEQLNNRIGELIYLIEYFENN